MSQIRLLQYGVGAMGSLMVQHLADKPNVEFVAAVDTDTAKIGQDLGIVAGLERLLGVRIISPDCLPDMAPGCIALHATTAFAKNAYPILASLLERRISVVTIAQELFFPVAENVSIGANLDRIAKMYDARLTAVGINPGFILDVLPSVCSVACREIKAFYGRRVVDFSPYGPDEMHHIGVGLTADEFDLGAKEGTIGHIGLLETAAMVNHCLGLEIERFHQIKTPLTSSRARQTAFAFAEIGAVYGFRQSVFGYRSNAEKLCLEMIAAIDPDEAIEGLRFGDYFRITGQPNIDVEIREQISTLGGVSTAAVAVNAIPALLEAPPGFHPIFTLRQPHKWTFSDHLISRAPLTED